MSITELSVKRPLLITIAFLALILFGVISYFNLNYELLPNFDAGVISINTTYPGASAEDIKNNITKPIEDAVSTIEGIDMVTSKSMENASSIIIRLKSGVNDVTAQQDVERNINQIKSTLPTNANDPVVNRFSTDQFPVLNLSVSAKTSEATLYQLLHDNILPELTNVQGVGQISLIGGDPREISVNLNNTALNAYHIPASQVYQMLLANTTAFPGGAIKTNHQQLSITVDADMAKVNTIRNMVLREDADGSRVLLKDVADITDGQEEIATINRMNGKEDIGLQVFKTNDANAVNVSKGVKQKLADIKKEYASYGFDYQIASDQSVYTLASAHAVVDDLMMAVLIVGFVMLMFLHSARSSMFVLVAIPSAMIPTFILMELFGFSLNLMTLTALSLVVGILVDDSIVILENIFRHLEMGKNKVQAALDGRSEIGFTAVAITMVDLVVFLPMALTGGLIGNIVRQFALVVVFSTLMSLFVSFTLTPMLASRFGKLIKPNMHTLWGRINNGFERILNEVKQFYAGILLWTLHHKRYLIILVVVLIIASISLIPTGFIGASFLGTSDRGELCLKLETSADMPLYQTNLLVKQAEAILLKHPEVVNEYALVGTQTGVMGNVSNTNLAEIDVSLVDKTKRHISTDNFGVMVRNEIEKIPGIQVTVIPTSITGSTNSPIQIVVKGADIDSVTKAANTIKEVMMRTPGTDYIQFSTKTDTRQIRITPDRQEMTSMGFTVQDIATAVNLSFSGNDKIDLKEKNDDYGINIELTPLNKQSVADVQHLMLVSKSGESVMLSQVASVQEVILPSVLERTDRLPSITITSSAVGRPSGTIVADIQNNLKSVTLPSNVSVDYRGDAKNQKDAFSSLGFALLIAIILVYMIMVALYESLVYPFVVIFSVPVATIGAFLALALTMNQLTIVTIIGMIMLLGLVTKNGILIVDFANHLKTKGTPVIEALLEAGKERFRPIIMTTFAMILGMLPLALSNSSGSEIKNGMAWVLIGGLTSSFLFTLLLVPSVYLIVEEIKQHFLQKKEKRSN
jgi:HAE1 family hydrophobic/amphiphilic exporter-1